MRCQEQDPFAAGIIGVISKYSKEDPPEDIVDLRRSNATHTYTHILTPIHTPTSIYIYIYIIYICK